MRPALRNKLRKHKMNSTQIMHSLTHSGVHTTSALAQVPAKVLLDHGISAADAARLKAIVKEDCEDEEEFVWRKVKRSISMTEREYPADDAFPLDDELTSKDAVTASINERLAMPVISNDSRCHEVPQRLPRSSSFQDKPMWTHRAMEISREQENSKTFPITMVTQPVGCSRNSFEEELAFWISDDLFHEHRTQQRQKEKQRHLQQKRFHNQQRTRAPPPPPRVILSATARAGGAPATRTAKSNQAGR